MNEGIFRNTTKYFAKPLFTRKQSLAAQDNKEKLWRTPEIDHGEELQTCRQAEIIRSLTSRSKDGVAFQSMAVSMMQTLRGVISRQRQAADAAISLAQGEKLKRMVGESEATVDAIAGILNDQGSHMLSLTPDDVEQAVPGNLWWFALSEVIESLDNSAARIMSLASCQPRGGPARQMSSVVVRLLRTQHQQLLAEADDWIN